MKHINPMKYINTMKHIITINRIIARKSRQVLLCALTLFLSVVGGQYVNARTFEYGERLYFNMRAKSVLESGDPALSGGWYATTSNYNSAYFFNTVSGAHDWCFSMAEKYKDDVYYLIVPPGDWDRVILTRHSSYETKWENVWTQTGNIYIDGEKNYIQNFYYEADHSGAYWQVIAPSPNGKPTGMDGSSWSMAYEDEEICTSASGTNYTLAPKNYDYDNSKCHAWFTYNNSTGNWDRFPGEDNWEFRSSEGLQDETATLGAANSDTYYFYQANKPSQCRLVRVRLNQDCSDGYYGACEITNFVAVASDANVTDKISAVDGEVAFDDKKKAGDLMIWCDYVDTVIFRNEEIKIPQTFKLNGFDASTEKTYTLHAKFLGSTSDKCSSSCNVKVAPPTTTIITHDDTNSPGSDLSLTRFTDQSITLYPENTSSTGFMWINSENDDRITTGDRNHTFTSSSEATITYTFIATNDPVVEEPNLISVGGSFESNSGFSSNYEYWGMDPADYYSTHSNASGGYAICSNSTKFSDRYNEVKPHEGNYFGLFDSKVYNGDDQDAWRVEGLSVQSGTSYLFSFWVANINNYGEMNNGAQLQFQISYNNGVSYDDIGDEIDLSDYRDNRWHGISSIVTPPTTVDYNVIIRVINKNRSSINRGNDFGLDDIRFEAITSRSSNVAAYEVFPVKFVECKITGATFSQRQPTVCGADKAVVDYTINFENPRGTLYIYEGTTKVVEIPFSATEGKTSYTGTFDGDLGKAEHELTVYFNDGVVKTDAPETYSYTAHAKPAISVTSMSWSTPACDETTCTLTAVLSYTNQNGTLSANVDGKWNVDPVPTYTSEDDDPRTVTLTIPGITADGNNHKLNVSFSGSHGCSTSVDPISPVVPKGNVLHSFSVKPEEVACDAERYQLRAGWRVSKATGGVYDKLIIKNKAGVVLATIDTITCDTATAILPQTYKIDSAHVEVSAYLEQRTDACAKEAKDYKTVDVPTMSIGDTSFVNIGCNKTTYDLLVAVKYKYQRGDLKAWIDAASYGEAAEGQKITLSDGEKCIDEGVTYSINQTSERTTYIKFSNLSITGTHIVKVECTGDKSCTGRTKAFTPPVLPVVDTVSVAYGAISCNNVYTTLKVNLKYANQPAGDLDIWVDSDTEHKITLQSSESQFTPNAALKTLAEQTISNVPADSLNTHVLHVKFKGSGGCEKEFTLPRAPFSPKIESVTVTGVPDHLTCKDASKDYKPIVNVVTRNHARDSVKVRFSDGTILTKLAADDLSFDYPFHPTNGKKDSVEVWFKSKPGCAEKRYIVAPSLPESSITSGYTFTPSTPACDVDSVDLSFELSYTYQDGNLEVWVDSWAHKTIAYDNHLDNTPHTKLITIRVPADGGTSHKLNYSFGSTYSCKESNIDLPTFPRTPMIASVAVKVPGKINCNAANYKDTVDVTLRNIKDETLIVEYKDVDGIKHILDSVLTAGQTTKRFVFDMDKKDGYAVDTVYVYFLGVDEVCKYKKGSVHEVIFDTPSSSAVKGGFKVDIKNNSECGELSYDLSGTVEYESKPATGKLVVEFSDTKYFEKPVSECGATSQAFSITGITTHEINKTLVAYFTDQEECKSHSKKFDTPDTCRFDVPKASMSFTNPACDEITTTLKFDLKYTYQSGTKLNVWVDSGTKIPVDFEADKNNELTISGIEIPGVSANGAAHTLHVEFVGGRCPADEFSTPVAPFSGKISNIQTPSISDEECGLNTYSVSVTFDVSANSVDRKVIATCKGKTGEKKVVSGTNTIKISNIVRSTPVEADDVVIELYFEDNDNCDPRHSITFDENPFKPIPTFSLDAIGAKCYPATSFDVTYDHTNADKLYYKVTKGETVKKDWAEVTVDATKKFTINTNGWADGAYTVEVYAKTDVGCESATPYPTATLTINKKPSLELAAIADVCDGTSGVSTAVTLKDGAAKYDYDVFKNGVLMSDQHKSGQTAASISLSTTTWEPATYKIQVTAYSSANCPSEPKEVSFTINPKPVIEALTASQTICEEDDAVSYDFTITGAETYSYSIEGTAIAETDISVPVGGSGTISFDPSELSDGNYTLQVIAKSELGCTTTRNAALKINNKPTVSLTATTNICYGDPAGLDFNYTVSADAKNYYLYLRQADRSKSYGGCGNFDLPTMNEGTIHYDSFSPFASPLSGGDYIAVMWVKNSAGCVSDSVVVPFTIYPIAGIQIYTVASMCATKPLSTVFYNIYSAKSFRYKIEGVTEWSDPQTPSTEDLKHFEFNISSLDPDNYTLQLQAYNDNCGYSNIVESPFTIYPLPTLNLDVTATGVNVCHPVLQVDIPYTSTDAKEYTYVLTGGGYNKTGTKSASTSGKIEVDTDGLPVGDYALSVTAISEHDCEIAAAQTTTIHINPRPTFTFKEGEVSDCYPSTSINVGYTSTNAKTYSYTLTLEGALSPALTVLDQEASADDVIALNTSGLAAGTYDLVVTATSEHGCDMLASVSRKVIILTQPKASVENIVDQCDNETKTTVTYTTKDAATYKYYIVGKTELSTAQTADENGSFDLDISSLSAGTYTLKLVANSATCVSDTVTETFTINPVPEVTSLTESITICEHIDAMASFEFDMTGAATFTWELLNSKDEHVDGLTDISPAPGVINIGTISLADDTYTLHVTPKSAFGCTGATKTATLVVNNQPSVTISSATTQCETGSSFLVEYVPIDAVSLTYEIKKGTATQQSSTIVQVPATAPYTFSINTTGWEAGTYTITGSCKSELGCKGGITPFDFEIVAPIVTITLVDSHCAGNATINANYETTDAATYYYEVVGTDLKGHADAQTAGSFTIDISNLDAATYTLRMTAKSSTCLTATDDETFTVYPIPTVGFVTPSPIKEGTPSLTVTLKDLDDADTYNWRFIDKDGSTELESGNDVPATQITITLTTATLSEGNYKLYVTPYSSNCNGTEHDVVVKVNNKPTINFDDEDYVVCTGTSTVSIPFSKSDDADKLTYSIKKGSVDYIPEQTIDLATPPSPLTVNTANFEYGTYTISGYATSDLGVDGEVSTKDFTILAQLTTESPAQPLTFIGCNETYTATVVVNLFNAAGRTIHAKYSDDENEYTPSVTTTSTDETATFVLSGLKDTGKNATNTVELFVEGFASCGITATYNLPQTMTIDQISAVCKPKSCNADKDTVGGSVTTDCNIGTIRVESYDDASIYHDIDLTTADRTYQLIIPSGGTPKVKAYFIGKTCAPVEQSYTPTDMPEASITAVVPATLDCDTTAFNLPFTLNYTYQQAGTLTVWVEDFPEKTKTFTSAAGDYSPLNPAPQTLTGTIDSLPADGTAGHKLHFRFDGAYSCANEITLDAFPKTPVIKSLTVVKDVEYIEGLTGEYYPTVTVTYEKAKGQIIVLEYFDKDDQPKYAESPEIDSDAEGSYVFDKTTVAGWSFDDVTMGERVVHAYFKGSQFNNCHEGGAHDGHYTAPTNCSIKFESIDAPTNKSTCDNLLYDLTGKVSFVGAALGDLIVELTIDGTTFSGKIDNALCVPDTELPFEIKNINKPIPDDGAQLTAYFVNLPTNTTISDDKVYTPAIPTINVVNPEYAKPECGVTTTSLTFELNYIRQQGALHLYLDEVEHDFEILTGSPLTFSDVEQTATITIADLSADLLVRTLRVQFDNDHSCDMPFPMPQAPFSPKVLTTDYEITDVVCDDETYTLTVSFTVENNQNKDATLSLRGTGAAVTANTTDGVTYTYTFTDVTRTFHDTSDDFVEVSFAASDADCSATPMLIPFTEKPKPVASVVSVVPVQPHCDSATFVLNFELSYTYQHGDVTVWVDDDKKAMKTFTIDPANYDQTAALPFIGQLSGTDLVADGSENHVLHFLFAGDHACGGESTLFDFPNTPLIDTIIISDVPDLVPGEDGTYQPTIKVAYKRAKGQKIILEYFDKDNVAHRDISSVLTLDKDTCTFSGLDFNDIAVAGDRKVNAYFEGAAFDDCHEGGTHTAIYRAPSNSSIEFIASELINTSTCDKLRYDLKGTVQFVGSAVGDLIVILDGTTFSTSIPEAQCTPNTPLPFEIKNVTAAISAEGKQLKAYFSGIPSNPAYSTEVHQQPVIPTVKVENATYATPQCNESVTSLTFDLKYIKQQGNLRLHLDGVECDYTIQTGAPLSLDDETEQTATIVINNLPANLSVRDLWVWFDGATGCSKDFTMPQAPYSPKVLTTGYGIKDVACDKDTYTLEVTFTVDNSQNKDATLRLRGTGAAVTANTTDGVTYTYTFTDVTRTFDDKDDDFVEVSFAESNADCSATPMQIPFTETAKPVASVLSVEPNQPACDVTAFTMDFKLSYTYQHGDVTVWVDDDEKAKNTFAIPEDSIGQSTAKTITGTLSGAGFVADGSTNHVLHFQFAGDNVCGGQSAAFDFPNTPLIKDVSVTNVPDYIEGVEGTYKPTVTVTYIRATGDKRIVIEYLDKDDKVQKAYSDNPVTGDDTYVFNNLTFDDVTKGDRTVHAYFEGSECTSGKGDGFNHDDEYKAPTNSSIKFESIDLPTNRSTCDKLLYDLTGTVSYVGATIGDLVVEFDADHKDVIPMAECMPGAMLSFAIRGISVAIPDEGKSLTAYFVGAETNFTISDKVYEPDQPSLAIDEVKVDTTFSCGSKRYDITVTVSSANQHGTCYVLDSIAGRVVSKAAIYEGTYNGTYEITINLPATDERHFIVVRYPATGCEVIGQAIDITTYTKPEPRITLSAIDRLCNTETELQLPFAITQGDIAGATITLTNSKNETVITAADMSINATRDTLSFSMSSQLAAGKYTATVEARDTLDCSTSATLPVEFALGGVVFSKWTDVLLVDNADGLFTGYQWYENDKQLEGKTDQVLYLPEGMSGKSYYCVLQTADGAIYTCVSDFGDLPRSADNPKPQSSNHITVLPNRVIANGAVTVRQSLDENLRLILMSATGKRVAEYTQTESAQLINMPSVQGIYLLRIETANDVQTVKIVVY